ncbi:probable glutamate carboxypeptidase AMP1 [Juglans microcarpa x Juglans regia]|uniref:probable glutamate carboxypeptidase AMP1 n=1 Tax=Juglans microcarpa x Juglans regia TaxID=2249226 RepID=UPI001B7EE095|nr:probable glutamate carboxypeptidase AMP1 [Juglans microcarpa x Juglans regia]
MAEAAFSKPGTFFFTPKPSPLSTFLLVLILCILGFYTLHYPHPTLLQSNSQNAPRFRQIFLSSATNYTFASYLRALTQHPHLAGTKPSLDTTHYVLSHFKDLGLETRTAQYRALLSYPVHSSLSAHFSDGTVLDLPLTDFTQATRDVVLPYHAYSPSGSAYAKAVFVNYGTDDDYRALGLLGVNVSGCVVIARKGDLPRGVVVQKAEAHGAVAMLLYAEGDGFRKGFERGTVMKGVGDPLSPGWAGVDGGESLDLEDTEVLKRFPKIPSMPLSAEAAEVILGSLGGAPFPSEWRIGIGHVGPGPTILNFTYQGEKRVVTIHNVFAVIRGLEEPDRHVLLGNHRDAWTYGAVDPNSGTAALLDIARRYALLMRLGWQPRRTIILCSWDAEEFGMIGSTEWVEQNLMNLGPKAVAYLNVDCAVQGPGFFVGATPQLDNLLHEVTKKVKDPDSEDATVYERWAATNIGIHIQRLSGVDSDFAPFLQHAGVPSVDLYYGRDFPVYHTAFDSYNWMTNYGDPLFQRHVAVAGIWGTLALHLADDSILPFNYLSYADQLQGYKNILSNILNGSVSLHPLTTSIQELASSAKEAENEAKILQKQETTDDSVVLKKRALNDRLMHAERGFLDADGLQGRQWFKHLIYGPPSDYESKLVFFPGVADAISGSARMSRKERKAAIQHEIWRAARAIQRAARALKGEFT